MGKLIRFAVILLFLYFAGVVTSGSMRMMKDWSDDVDFAEVAGEVLEEGLAWPVKLLKWLDLV